MEPRAELLEVDGILESSALVREAVSTGSMVRTDAVLDHLTDLVSDPTWLDATCSSELEEDRASFVVGTKDDATLGSEVGEVDDRESLVLGTSAMAEDIVVMGGDRFRSFCVLCLCCCSDKRRSPDRKSVV